MKIRSAVLDRRIMPRHLLRIPLRVRLWKSCVPEENSIFDNLSACGASFSTGLPVQLGSVLEVLFPMPEEVTGEPLAEWRCSGHVVRVVQDRSSKYKVAIQFDCYEVARVLPSPAPEPAI
jgi:hypothetical protein